MEKIHNSKTQKLNRHQKQLKPKNDSIFDVKKEQMTPRQAPREKQSISSDRTNNTKNANEVRVMKRKSRWVGPNEIAKPSSLTSIKNTIPEKIHNRLSGSNRHVSTLLSRKLDNSVGSNAHATAVGSTCTSSVSIGRPSHITNNTEFEADSLLNHRTVLESFSDDKSINKNTRLHIDITVDDGKDIFFTEVKNNPKKAWLMESPEVERRISESRVLQLHQNYKPESSDSEQYDTDIEESFPEAKPKVFDSTGGKQYRKQCRKYNLVPINSLIKQLAFAKVEMKYRGLGVDESIAIAKTLHKNNIVREIDLSDNHIQKEGGLAFVDMLHKNHNITTLNLSDNQLLPEAGIEFARLLQVNCSLLKLVLKGNHLTDRVARVLAESLKTNDVLIELDLSYNEFCEQGGLYLGAGLALNRSLRILNLKWNSIRAKGAVSLAAALKKNEHLTDLNLSWNGISHIGCLALGRHLKSNKTLKTLDISNNRIGPNSTTKLIAGLENHPCIEEFKVGLNPIGDEGVANILNAAHKNKTLKMIGLQDIRISQSTLKVIENLETTRNISVVTGGLGGYNKGKPPPSGMDVLIQFIQDNRMRLTDLFFQWDKDRSGDISKAEFYNGLIETGLKMNKAQLLHLIDQLDENNDGNIDFSEIAAGRRLVLDERRFQKKVAFRTEEREEQSIELPIVKGF